MGMNRRLGFVNIAAVALNMGIVGGVVTPSLADEAGIEARVGELRGAVLSLFAPAGAVATETNPNYKAVAASAPAAPSPAAAGDWEWAQQRQRHRQIEGADASRPAASPLCRW